MALLLGFKKNTVSSNLEACAQLYSVATGSLLDTLKHPFDNALEVASVDYSPQSRAFFGTDKKTNFIFVWSLQRKNRKYLTFNVGVRPHVLSISLCGTFCAAAVGTNIYIWQIINGNLLCVISGHFQPISLLKFTNDSRFLLSAGEDGLILVWDLVDCVAKSDGPSTMANAHRPPVYKWNEHSQAVTGLVVGCGDLHARVFSCSLDHTFRIWDLLCGLLLSTVSFDVSLTALAVDFCEARAFVAIETGKLLQINLFAPPPNSFIVKSSNQSVQSFDGHSSPCKHCAVSVDGLTLVSVGSAVNDRIVRIWHIPSRQCIREVKLKGEVTDMHLIYPIPAGFSEDTAAGELSSATSLTLLKPFHRTVTSPKVFTVIARKTSFEEEDGDDGEDSLDDEDAGDKSQELRHGKSITPLTKNDGLAETNRRLYDFLASRILSGDLNNSTLNSSAEDVIIVENSGEEDGDESEAAAMNTNGVVKPQRTKKPGRMRGRVNNKMRNVGPNTRRSLRLKKKRRVVGMGTAETILD